MPDSALYAAETRIPTQRAERYLVQLCEHLTMIAQVTPHSAMSVDYGPQRGTIAFADGTCTLTADPTALQLRIEASDYRALTDLQASFAHRVEQIGRRDGLSVSWTPA